jgi:hypothetical protein
MSDQAYKNEPSAHSELGENFAAHAQLAMQLRATPAEVTYARSAASAYSTSASRFIDRR